MRPFVVMVILGGLAGIVSGFRDRGWDSWNDDVLVYVGWLSFAGAVAGLLLGISLAAWRRHGWQAGFVAVIVPFFFAFLGLLVGVAAAPSDWETYPDFSRATWGAAGGLLGLACGLLLVVIAAFPKLVSSNGAADGWRAAWSFRPSRRRRAAKVKGRWLR